jgi:hypothetical protein
MLLPDRGYEKKYRPYGAFAGGVNRLEEYAVRVFGVVLETTGAGQRILRETDAGEDGSEATTAATQAAVNALMPDFPALDSIRRP